MLIASFDPGSVFAAVMMMVIFASLIGHGVEMRRAEKIVTFIMIQDSIRDITDKELISLTDIVLRRERGQFDSSSCQKAELETIVSRV